MGESEETRHQFQGDLGTTALPEMLHTVYMHRVPGVIEARRGEVSKKIFVREGAVIHASSTDRDDSLGTYLLAQEKITRRQYEETLEKSAEVGRRHGELLVESGVLSPEQLYMAIQEQIRAVVWSLFSWTQGQVTFDIGDFEDREMVRIHLPMRQVILQGIKRAPDAKTLVGRLGRKETAFEPTYTTEDLVEIAVNSEELELLRLVDGRKNLYQMCTSGPFSPAENARILYAFHVLRLMKRSAMDRPSGALKIRFPSSS